MSISNVSSRKFNVPSPPMASATKPAPKAHTPEMGPPPGPMCMQFKDMFEAGPMPPPSSGNNAVSGTGPGSRAFGDKLHHALQSAGVDDETIKTVLGGLNGGQPADAQPDANGLGSLMSRLDTDSSGRLQRDGASLEQLLNNPELTAQLAQAPELFQLLMDQHD